MPTDRTVIATVSPAEGVVNDTEVPFGSMGEQDADDVEITGGTISGVTITGSVVPFSPVAVGVSAAGSAQGDATLIGLGLTQVSTASASTGVRLPAPAAGNAAIIRNDGAQTLSVYPATGGKINGLSTNAAFSVAATKTVILWAASATQWFTLLGA